MNGESDRSHPKPLVSYIYRFNCEHWARLVTTGDCRFYQIANLKRLQQILIVGLFVVGVAGVITGA